jgi:hypothetical protein
MNDDLPTDLPATELLRTWLRMINASCGPPFGRLSSKPSTICTAMPYPERSNTCPGNPIVVRRPAFRGDISDRSVPETFRSPAQGDLP